MTADERLRTARDQLALVLSFFGRVETKLSVVLGIDLAMLGFLASHFPRVGSVHPTGWIGVCAFLVFTALSLWKLYQGSFPQLEGGSESLIYSERSGSELRCSLSTNSPWLRRKPSPRTCWGRCGGTPR